LYVGVTSDLIQRVWQHKNDAVEGFTKRYSVHTLVWYEPCGTMGSAIAREKAIKEWKRAWKIRLIEGANPGWRDLYEDLL
jgi:putative endonuclease